MKLRVPFLVCVAVVIALTLGALGLRSQAQSSQAQQQQAPAAPAIQDPAAIHYSFGGNAAQIPATFLGNQIFVPVTLNGGTPALFLVDTAAEHTTVEPTAGDSASSLSYVVLRMPGIAIPMPTLPVLAHPKFQEAFGDKVRGVLGRDVLSRMVVELNYIRQTLQLYDPTAFNYEGKGTTFPIAMSPAGPTIRAKFQLSGHKAYDVPLVIDTALDYSLLLSRSFTDSQKISASHFKATESSDLGVNDGERILLGRAEVFDLKPYVVQNSIVAFSQQNLPGTEGTKIAGAVGGGFLRRFNAIIDMPHEKLILDATLAINTPEDSDMSGLTIVAKGANLRTFTVVSVQKGTPGHDAGVEPGDVIAGLDDEAAADLTLNALRDAFRRADYVGHTYKLLVDRNGQTQTLKLKLRRLV
jgi:PDZ domain